MKMYLISILVLACTSLFSHEGGHGIEESGKFGGVMAPVISALHENHSAHAQTLFKAEFVRLKDGTLRIYLLDTKTKSLLPLTDFSEKIQAKLEVKRKGKFVYVGEFSFVKDGTNFKATLPTIEERPFNIDMYLSHKDQKLFVGFAGLD